MLKIDQSQLVMQVILAFITLMIVIIYDLIISICIKIIQIANKKTDNNMYEFLVETFYNKESTVII